MNDKKLFLVDGASDNLLSNLDSRDVALWLTDSPKERRQLDTLASFLGLPWRLVLSEVSDNQLITELEQRSRSDDDMARRRGFVQIVDSDPSRIAFPQRCLPIYLLNGREGSSSSEFENKLRRMTMVEDLRRSGVRQVLVLSGDDYPIPLELTDLWDSGFRTQLTVTSELENAATVLQQWLERSTGYASVSLSLTSPSRFIESVLSRYVERFAEQRRIVRVRDQFGNLSDVEIFELAAHLERKATGQDLLGAHLAIVAAGEGDRGGTHGVIRELICLRGLSRTCLTKNGRPAYRFVALFDNDRAGQQAVRAAASIDTSIIEFRDVFRLHPRMPTSGNLDPKTLQKAFERENADYKGMNWELEDLLPEHFVDALIADHPSAVVSVKKVGDKIHRELTRDGKAILRKLVKQYANRADLSATIAVLKAFHFYCSIQPAPKARD